MQHTRVKNDASMEKGDFEIRHCVVLNTVCIPVHMHNTERAPIETIIGSIVIFEIMHACHSKNKWITLI